MTTSDWDGKIRMDQLAEPSAMASVTRREVDDYDILDRQRRRRRPARYRHATRGLMNPNHYLAVAIHYLYAHRTAWRTQGGRRQDARQEVG